MLVKETEIIGIPAYTMYGSLNCHRIASAGLCVNQYHVIDSHNTSYHMIDISLQYGPDRSRIRSESEFFKLGELEALRPRTRWPSDGLMPRAVTESEQTRRASGLTAIITVTRTLDRRLVTPRPGCAAFDKSSLPDRIIKLT